jgi:hypothetical protein
MTSEKRGVVRGIQQVADARSIEAAVMNWAEIMQWTKMRKYRPPGLRNVHLSHVDARDHRIHA